MSGRPTLRSTPRGGLVLQLIEKNVFLRSTLSVYSTWRERFCVIEVYRVGLPSGRPQVRSTGQRKKLRSTTEVYPRKVKLESTAKQTVFGNGLSSFRLWKMVVMEDKSWHFEMDKGKGGRMFYLRDGCTHKPLNDMLDMEPELVELSYPLPDVMLHQMFSYDFIA
ncbi:unnamed protein product [Microthlaspi erraticum]|uniref:Uncharacterized protein n=1 Tax=Microthlaspi erraticum TaxID=1685480 RepID=A0A6D2HRY9_9BRAS|nr:unnamed protein product [Microthlaspi erraticum]